jgi:hypothetical protein
MGYLTFHLYSHTRLYDSEEEAVVTTAAHDTSKLHITTLRKRSAERDLEKLRFAEQLDRLSVTNRLQATSRAAVGSSLQERHTVEKEEEEQPLLNLWMSLGLLVVATVVSLKFRISISRSCYDHLL